MSDRAEIIETAKRVLEYGCGDVKGTIQLARAVIDMAEEIEKLLGGIGKALGHIEYSENEFDIRFDSGIALRAVLSQPPTPGEEGE